MPSRFKCGLLPVGLSLCAATAMAATTPNPLDAQAPVPTIQHRSPLAGYQPWRDHAALPWREANDQVGRIGGWRAYAREAAEAAKASTAAKAPAATSATAGQPTPASAAAAVPANAPADAPADAAGAQSRTAPGATQPHGHRH